MFLLDEPIRFGDAPSVILADLSGWARPRIDKPIAYKWRIDLKGSKQCTCLRELKVSLKFSDNSLVTTREIKPSRSEVEEKATLTFSIIPNFIQATLPVTDNKFIGRITPEGAEWIYKDIDLPEALSQSIIGGIVVEFFERADGKKVKIGMRVEPDFCKKSITGWKSVPNQPIIEYQNVMEHCSDIIPYNPIYGPSSYDSPDEERIQEYEWVIDEGILKKMPGIRNVALRAETLAILFKEIQKSLPEERYREVMRAIGKKTGENFIANLENRLKRKLTLKEVSDYDSAAGMGRYIFHDTQELHKIELKNSFIAYGYGMQSKQPVCDWFAGYFEGMLEMLNNQRFFVTEEECIARGDPFCTFNVSTHQL